MDQSTQQNAAMVEETSAAARNLAGEVGQLADQAGRFKVGRTAAVRRPAPAATRAPAYTSPVRALPAAPVPALVGADDDWKEF